MIFEASKTIGPGRSITARLDAGANRIRMETAGHIAHQEQAAFDPSLQRTARRHQPPDHRLVSKPPSCSLPLPVRIDQQHR